jgi:hypothetical protein
VSIVHSVRNIIRTNAGPIDATLRQICWLVGLEDLPPGTTMSAPVSDEDVAMLLEHFGNDAEPGGAAESPGTASAERRPTATSKESLLIGSSVSEPSVTR